MVYSSDTAVRVSPARYLYPDATVTCAEGDQPSGARSEVEAPRLVVEVLAETTEARDRGQKLAWYPACLTVQEYVLVSTACQLVKVYRRGQAGWTYTTFSASEAAELTSIGARVPLSAIYRRTAVPLSGDEPPGDSTEA
jgi:Uma2 family endonuclease